MADHAADIAEILPHLFGVRQAGDPAVSRALEMGRKAHKMILDALAALSAEDQAAAQQVIAADDAVDADFDQIKQMLAQEIAACPANVDAALDLLMVIKYLERIGGSCCQPGRVGPVCLFWTLQGRNDVQLNPIR